jgi:hypothetical protein
VTLMAARRNTNLEPCRTSREIRMYYGEFPADVLFPSAQKALMAPLRHGGGYGEKGVMIYITHLYGLGLPVFSILELA